MHHGGLQRLFRFAGQREDPLRVVEQHPARGGELQAAAFAQKHATSSSASRLRTRVVTLDCTRCSCAAARVMPPALTTVRNT